MCAIDKNATSPSDIINVSSDVLIDQPKWANKVDD